MKDSNKTKLVVILNNIRSNENVGSIFRTADGAGVSKIFLVGYTPTPVDKFGRKNKAIAKSALGAEETVPWEKIDNLKKVISKLKKEDYKIIAVEQDEKSTNYKLLTTNYNSAFVFGNEVTGIPKKELKLCDAVVEIPMKGEKESLNVSVSAGIILFNT